MAQVQTLSSAPIQVQVPPDMRFDNEEDQIVEALNKDPHIGYLITSLEIAHEQRHDNLVLQKKADVDAFKQDNLNLHSLLDVLGNELSKPSNTIIDLMHHGELLKAIHAKHPNNILGKVLENNKITRDEAKTLEQALGRYMQIVTQEISHEITRLTRLIEDKYQNTKIFQQLLQMLQEMGKTLTRNQRPG
jgi:hypothetical protein